MPTDWVRFAGQAEVILRYVDTWSRQRAAPSETAGDPVQLLRVLVGAVPAAERGAFPGTLWPLATSGRRAYVVARVVLEQHAISSAFGLADEAFASVVEAAVDHCREAPLSLAAADTRSPRPPDSTSCSPASRHRDRPSSKPGSCTARRTSGPTKRRTPITGSCWRKRTGRRNCKKGWRPQRDSNPCFGLERATSWASGRWGRLA